MFAKGWESRGNECLMDMRFTFGVIKIFWNLILMMVVQHCDYIKCHWIVRLKMVKMVKLMCVCFITIKT